jgi:hypothetical protein
MPFHRSIANEESVVGNVMATWRRMFLVAHIWLTAFAVMFAGLPHFRCLCPSEYAKPISLNGPFQISKCCNAGSCCSSSIQVTDRSDDLSTASEAKRPCCCCHGSSAQKPDKNNQHDQLNSSGCKRTLIEADPALPSSQQPVNDCLTAGVLIADAAPSLLDLSRQAGDFLLPWQSHAEPPPTDLVLTLQHFVI